MIIIISSSLVETISNLENLQREYQNTPYNVIIKNAKNRQYEAIKDNKEVKALGLESFIGSSVDKKVPVSSGWNKFRQPIINFYVYQGRSV